MNEQPTDDDLRALRALDPAADARAPEALRRRVAALSARGEPSTSGGSTAPGTAAGRNTAARGARRRRLAPVAAAALVVATTATVFALGPGVTPGAGAPMALTTTAPGEIAPPVDLGAAGGSVSANAEHQTGEDSLIPPSWDYGPRRRFSVPMLDDTAGKATVYVVDSAAWYTPEQAARVAAALGVPGDPVVSEYGWSVNTYETGGVAGVGLWNGGHLDYWTGLQDPLSACYAQAGPDGGEAFRLALEECVAEVPMPAEEQARTALSSLLTAIGIEEDTVSVSVAVDPGCTRGP